MKRILALTLCLFMLVGCLCSCRVYHRLFGYDTEYTGPVYTMYFNEMPTTLDPMYAYLDDSSMYIMSLIYEGLFKYDENGKVVNALAKEYKKTLWDTEKGEFQIEITIKDSHWSDQSSVQASQFIYAWRRILQPDNTSAAAVLLYDIKNAREVKTATGTLTKFDFGAVAIGTKVLRIDLVGKQKEDGTFIEPDLDSFFAKLASPMLVPLRDNAVAKLDDWASSNATVPCNGPFYLKLFTYQEDLKNLRSREIKLLRNKYYLRDDEVDPLDTYVKPYAINIMYSINQKNEFDITGKLINQTPYFSSAEEQLMAYYNAGNLDYLSYLPMSERENFKNSSAVTRLDDTLFTHTYYFNTEHPLFKDAKVRQALSMAIDRTELANRLVFAKAANTIVNPAAFETGYTKKNQVYFNDKLTSSVKVTADTAEAKKLFESANVDASAKTFTISVKDGDASALATAEYCKEVWEGLGVGLSVNIRKLGAIPYVQNDYDGVYDTHLACFMAGGKPFIPLTKDGVPGTEMAGYDVIAVESYMNSTDPFTTLAPFSKYFSGGAVDLSVVQEEDYDPVLPTGGYDSEAFNAEITAAFNAENASDRAAHLHEAEKILMEDMPVMPLYVSQTPVIASSSLKKISYTLGGAPDFSELTVKNYVARTEDEIMLDTVKKAGKEE